MCLAHGMRMCDLSGFIQVGLRINYPMQKDKIIKLTSKGQRQYCYALQCHQLQICCFAG